ncbi:MAG: adenylate/guanylate cyclase domain-containing protein [Desulfarculaceae bacterium]|jgi:class 3 adenylate cyclase/ketosteroid isomerase-like protein
MEQEGIKRRLAAILSADAVGYSRLMGDDEVATVRTITSCREVMARLITQHQGRVVDSPGDNLLAEFSSVVDALSCALAVQEELGRFNSKLPLNRRMLFRIGINLGDILAEGGRIYGDGVNIAARLEAQAQPGGICISGTVYDQVKNKLPLGYHFQGEQKVKNITDPVRVYAVTPPETPAPDFTRRQVKEKNTASRLLIPGVVLALAAALGLTYWLLGGEISSLIGSQNPSLKAEKEIQAMLASWQKAWNDQDAEAILAHYGKDASITTKTRRGVVTVTKQEFAAILHMKLRRWQGQGFQRLLAGAPQISVSGQTAKVSLPSELKVAGAELQSRVRDHLRLIKRDGRWLILDYKYEKR